MTVQQLPQRRLAARRVLTSVPRPRVHRAPPVFALLLALLGSPVEAYGQYENISLPVQTIERHLRYEEFEVVRITDTRFEGDRTQHAALRFSDGLVMLIKWAAAPRGGDAFNNRPRFEIAAYEIQKLFLNEEDYVVPPAVARAIPLERYPAQYPPEPTFSETASVLVVAQYWLSEVTSENVYDKARLESDSVYARHLGNLNILTYLIRHADANKGNFLVSTDSGSPRVFAVDNGVAFGDRSDRPDDWRKMRVDSLPRGTVERLRGISEEDLHRALGVLVQYEIRDGQLIEVPPTQNLRPNRGVRREDGLIQLGLTAGEIRAVYRRLEDLLEEIDSGKIETF
ncbi:MAG: hypothetical protein JSV41_13850 [Gemmatimonadota bacterium]|nr:MAG: hypothetical protein JSV41_13850 [Gemmatimonadota bacterium]